ncbi:MAG: DNA repair protein RadA [Acidimicrobiales bacterium]
MAQVRTGHRCGACGATAPRWAGRCPGCGEWNSLVAQARSSAPGGRSAAPGEARSGGGAPPVRLDDVDASSGAPRPTTIAELDRVLGGGLVPGSVTLLGGEPGIGKSTLLLQALAGLAADGARCLLVTAEESLPQVRRRAERLGLCGSGRAVDAPGADRAAGVRGEGRSGELWLVPETSLADIVETVGRLTPDHLVVDSIQTVSDGALGSGPGSVAQVRECAHRLVQLAKEQGMATLLVGHVTKDGGLAGPRVLEHVVDTVLSFEGERHHALRMLRALKHRFGPTGELGLFEMGERGLACVPDAGGRFLADRRPGAAGSIVAPLMEGRRPLLVEIQALVAPSGLVQPRRSAQGLDGGRLSLILAVLERRTGLGLGSSDVYASAAGGVRVVEPAADLALALAVASSWSGVALPEDLVACAEVGLGGELRQVAQPVRRLTEAARLGFRRVITASTGPDAPPGITVLRADSLEEALELFAPADPTPRPGRDGWVMSRCAQSA